MAVMKDNIKFKKKIQKFNYPKDIDQELISLLDVINSIPGVRTLFSCCGHGKEEFYIVLAYTSS
jgi:tRNA(Phe) wybutosine-synthesizing methylase Tyw3